MHKQSLLLRALCVSVVHKVAGYEESATSASLNTEEEEILKPANKHFYTRT